MEMAGAGFTDLKCDGRGRPEPLLPPYLTPPRVNGQLQMLRFLGESFPRRVWSTDIAVVSPSLPPPLSRLEFLKLKQLLPQLQLAPAPSEEKEGDAGGGARRAWSPSCLLPAAALLKPNSPPPPALSPHSYRLIFQQPCELGPVTQA